MSHISSPRSPSVSIAVWKPLLFLAVLVIGLWYVKWQPYYFKALTASDTHSIGKSILANASDRPLQAAWEYALVYFLAVWKAAVLGVILGSLVQVLIPKNWIARTLGQPRFRGTFFGTLFSLPGMMCTCCAAPVAAGMRKSSASVGGTLAFWIGNPVLNPATLIFMGFVLGWQFAAIRLVAGLLMVLGIAWMVQRIVPEKTVDKVVPFTAKTDSTPFLQRWLRVLWSLFWNTIPIYILAVLLLGAARVWLFPHLDGVMGNTLFWVVAMAIAGCLFVIPTAAEIPVIQTLMMAGMGVAPGLALLMTLPAVSVPSLIMLHGALPARALWLTGALVALSGMIVGCLGLLLL